MFHLKVLKVQELVLHEVVCVKENVGPIFIVTAAKLRVERLQHTGMVRCENWDRTSEYELFPERKRRDPKLWYQMCLISRRDRH